MKALNRRVFKKYQNLTNWKIGDFVLQLLVVILGIVITFTISNAVAKHAKAKEVEQTMHFIKSEIEMNMQNVQKASSVFQSERRAASYILRYKDSLGSANPDSLVQYAGAPFYSDVFSYTKDAMEILKSASLVQHVKNKELILQIIKAYNSLEDFKVLTTWYYNAKEKKGERLNTNREFNNTFNALFSSSKNIPKSWEILLNNNDVVNLLTFAAMGANFQRVTHNAEENINQALQMLQKEYIFDK